MGLNLATIPNPDGGGSLQVPVNASSYTGIQFWIWGSADGGTQNIIVQLPDKQETAGLGVCDNTVPVQCGGATANITVAPGWHFQQLPLATFIINPSFGIMNEMTIDTTTLTQVQWQIQQTTADAGAGTPFIDRLVKCRAPRGPNGRRGALSFCLRSHERVRIVGRDGRGPHGGGFV
jgi:hypothetical protein